MEHFQLKEDARLKVCRTALLRYNKKVSCKLSLKKEAKKKDRKNNETLVKHVKKEK